MQRRRPFTFIEVVVATAILSLAITMILGIVGAARSRVLRAERRWARQHVMSQACEFYLLAGPRGRPPGALLPQGFSASCTLEPVDDLPVDTVDTPRGWNGWKLGRFRVSVTGSYHDRIDEWTIEKLVRDDDF